MVKVKRFEDLECWKEARILVKMIYVLIRKKKLSKDYRLSDRITDAGVSVMSSIAEGFDNQSNNEFGEILKIAIRSLFEVTNCLYVAVDQGYIIQREFKIAFTQAGKVKQLIEKFLRC